jgi:hypothetical protein
VRRHLRAGLVGTSPDDRDQRLRRLEEAERCHDLFGFRVDGWSAWRVTRHTVQRIAASYNLVRPKQNDGLRILWAIVATVKLAAILALPPRVGLLVKTQRSGLRLAVGDRYRDIYFDGLLASNDDHFKIEVIDTGEFEAQARVALFPPHLNAVVFTFWGRLLGKLWPADAAEFSARTSAILKDEVGVDIPASAILMLVSTAYWQSRLFGLLLRRLRPAAALVSDTGEYGLVIACRKAGIPIVELQHGVFDASHPDAIPVWAQGSGTELVLPDVLATRNSFWIQQLAGCHQAVSAVPVGNEMIDRAREKRAVRQAELRNGPAVKRILVTTQGTQSERLAAWLEAMLAAAPAGQAWRLMIKLHPTYDTQTTAYDGLADHPDVTVIPGGGQPNVFDLLSEADIHLSIASACLFEAAALQVPSLIIPLEGHQDVLPALDGTLLRLATSPADVWAEVPARPPGAAEIHAEPGFLSNMRALLSRV